MADEKAERAKRPIRAYDDFADMVRDIGFHRELNMEDVLEKYAGPSISREYRRVIQEKTAVLGEAGA